MDPLRLPLSRSRFAFSKVQGIGLGLRWAFIDHVEADPSCIDIDFFELSPENYMRRGGWFPRAIDRIGAHFALLTHGLMMNIGSTDPLDAAYLRELRAFIERVGARYHSDHLCWTGSKGQTLHDLLPLWRTAATIERVSDNLRRASDALGVPMAIENISHYARDGGKGMMPEAEFISAILERADCGLMLDVNNVQVNADNHGFDALEFIRQLPLDRVVQLHVAGGERRHRHDDLIIDTHGSDVDGRVRQLMAEVIAAVGPKPVVYERDHCIPPLATLATQVAQLQDSYDLALERHLKRSNTLTHAAGLSVSSARKDGSTAPALEVDERAALDGFSQLISATDFELALTDSAAAQPGETDKLWQEFGVRRIRVYRDLVRGSIEGTVDDFLERTKARVGTQRFDSDVAAWLAECGPRSKFLRDLPHEFVTWVEDRWRACPELPAYAHDLARHELVVFEVSAAPEFEGEPNPAEIELGSVLLFQPALRMSEYGHAVHELTDDLDDFEPAQARPTTLLSYRDSELQVRYLELTPFATQLTRAALEATPLGAAVTSACAATGLELDADSLSRAATLLADFVERGIVVSHRPGASA